MTTRTKRRAPAKKAPAPGPKPGLGPGSGSGSGPGSGSGSGSGSNDIAHWPELKLEIVSRYASAYSRVLSRQPGLAYYYINGFAGPSVRVSKPNGEFVPGSPLNTLLVTPPFRHHYLLDLDGGRAETLRGLVADRDDVTVLEGDSSRILLEELLPRVRSSDYRRALCVLDPCGSNLDWRVLEAAGRLGTIDLFVSLPVADVNGERRRLKEVARFAHVPEPLALRDRAGRIVSQLFFASRNDTANTVVEGIFARHRDRDGRAPEPST